MAMPTEPSATPSDRLDWEGGPLDELLEHLSAASMSCRVFVRSASGANDAPLGEVDMVAGGVTDVRVGDLAGDAAVELLRKLQKPRCRIEARLPDPDSAEIDEPGPRQGRIEDLSVPDLMRYAEEFVLTCVLVVTRDGETASIRYERGEITKTLVGGRDDSERLADVMQWRTGDFRVDLPRLGLPKGAPRPQTTELAALWKQVAPQVIAKRSQFADRQRESGRSTRPYQPTAESASGAQFTPHKVEGRSTNPGLPVDVYDPPPAGERPSITTPAPRLNAAVLARIQTPQEVHAPAAGRNTAQGFDPVRPRVDVDATYRMPRAPRHLTPIRTGNARRSTAEPRRIADLPFLVHVAIGIGVGVAIVIAYRFAGPLVRPLLDGRL